MEAGPRESERYEITVRINHVARFFNSLDPSPFHERDLDRDAERFIVEWAQEAPGGVPIILAVQLPREEQDPDLGPVLSDAVHNNFDYRASQATQELRELLREGWHAMLVGVPVLALSLIVSQLVGYGQLAAPYARAVGESLLILGWVANWRPLEIFLYGWWPIVRRRLLYRRLAAAAVEVRWV